MTTGIFLISSVREITEEKLLFMNNEKQIQEISLLECRKNWVEHFNENDFITWEGNPAPKIKFEIRPKKRGMDYFFKHWKQKYYKKFRDIDEGLHEVVLSTLKLF